MSDTNNCPVCDGPASIGYRAASTNPAMCGMHGWTADCNAACDGAPYVSRFTREAARLAWNELTTPKEPV